MRLTVGPICSTPLHSTLVHSRRFRLFTLPFSRSLLLSQIIIIIIIRELQCLNRRSGGKYCSERFICLLVSWQSAIGDWWRVRLSFCCSCCRMLHYLAITCRMNGWMDGWRLKNAPNVPLSFFANEKDLRTSSEPIEHFVAFHHFAHLFHSTLPLFYLTTVHCSSQQ